MKYTSITTLLLRVICLHSIIVANNRDKETYKDKMFILTQSSRCSSYAKSVSLLWGWWLAEDNGKKYWWNTSTHLVAGRQTEKEENNCPDLTNPWFLQWLEGILLFPTSLNTFHTIQQDQTWNCLYNTLMIEDIVESNYSIFKMPYPLI